MDSQEQMFFYLNFCLSSCIIIFSSVFLATIQEMI